MILFLFILLSIYLLYRLYGWYYYCNENRKYERKKPTNIVKSNIKLLERCGYYTTTLHMNSYFKGLCDSHKLEYDSYYYKVIANGIFIDNEDLNCMIQIYTLDYPVNRFSYTINYTSSLFRRFYKFINSKKIKEAKSNLSRYRYYTDVMFDCEYVNKQIISEKRYFSNKQCMEILEKVFNGDNFYKSGYRNYSIKILREYSEMIKRNKKKNTELDELILVGYVTKDNWALLIENGFEYDYPDSFYEKIEDEYGAVYVRKTLVASFNKQRKDRIDNHQSFPISMNEYEVKHLGGIHKRMDNFEKNILKDIFKR